MIIGTNKNEANYLYFMDLRITYGFRLKCCIFAADADVEMQVLKFYMGCFKRAIFLRGGAKIF